MESPPKISIITACRNASATIGDTVRSVLSQGYDNYEHIIVDGASTDGTIELVKEFDDHRIVFSSEPDRGIADAWNKGLRKCSGDIVGILNADDQYLPSTFRTIAARYSSNPIPTVYFGNTVMIDHVTGASIREIPGSGDLSDLFNGFKFMHPSCFVPKAVYGMIGEFNLKYSIACDTDFLLRAVRAGIAFTYADVTVLMKDNGLSARNEVRARLQYLSQLNTYKFIPLPRVLRGVVHVCLARLVKNLRA